MSHLLLDNTIRTCTKVLYAGSHSCIVVLFVVLKLSRHAVQPILYHGLDFFFDLVMQYFNKQWL